MFRKLGLIPSSGEGEDTYSTLLGTLQRANSNLWDPTEYVSPPPSPEDGNRSSFRNIVDKVRNPSKSECHTPSSELFITEMLCSGGYLKGPRFWRWNS
jgi:hypothetical protein